MDTYVRKLHLVEITLLLATAMAAAQTAAEPPNKEAASMRLPTDDLLIDRRSRQYRTTCPQLREQTL